MAKTPKQSKLIGRHSSYTDEIGDMICEDIAQGHALYRLCVERDDYPPEGTIYRWLESNVAFREKYTRARERQADRNVDEIIDIADTVEDPQRARVMIDARKWRASKLAAKKYGEKVAVGGDADQPLAVELIKRVIIRAGDKDA